MKKAAVSVLTAALLVVSQQAYSAAKKGFGETTSVVVVEVPVTVLVDGKPVRGLTKENFEVLDGRTEQPIVGFDVVDLTATPTTGSRAAQRTLVPTAGRRHFLFLFDLSFAEPSSIVRARAAARDVLANQLHPQDLAAVATYSLKQGPRLILGFTPDRSQLLLALDTLGSPQLVSRVVDPLGLVFASPAAANPNARQGRQATDEALQETISSLGTSAVNSARQEQQFAVTNMTRQMADLAKMLGSVEGRKYVVLLSEGFDETLLVGTGTRSAGQPPEIDSVDAEASSLGESSSGSALDNQLSGNLSNVSSDAIYGSGAVQNDLSKMITEFQRGNSVIHAIDIGGLRAGGGVRPKASGQNSLVTMAKDTGGQVYTNFNDASSAMGELLEATSVTYLIAIQPNDLKRDGKYHRLKVKLKNVPRGADVSHRQGFYAPAPLDQQSSLERNLRTASQVLDQEGGSISTWVLAAPFAGKDGNAYVPLVVEIDGAKLIEGTVGDVAPVELYAYALDPQGAVLDFFTHTLNIDIKAGGAQLRQSGLKYFGHLDLPPGDYEVRVFVRNLKSSQSTLKVLPLAVPDFGKRQAFLSQPLATQGQQWVMVREEASRQKDVPYPFMRGEAPYIPSARLRLARSGEAEVTVPAHFLWGGEIEADARLVTTDGRVVDEAELIDIQQVKGPGGADCLVLKIKTNGVASGGYRLEVEVSDPASGQQALSSAEVEVVG
ncbi:MAG TPA: VWA domain-containing protein [Thermoanaerobaculia bacterium]|nr:VWA domain-containing protein [Thermoanaerobaculia bacterium]